MNELETVARSWLSEAARARQSGGLLGAASAYRKAIDAAQSAGCRDVLAIAHDNLGNVLADLGDFDAALAHFENSRQYETDPRSVSIIVSNKARVFGQLGYLRESARLLLDRATALETSGAAPLDVGVALDNAADALVKLGEYAQARALLERAREALAHSDAQPRAINAINLSTLYGVLKDFPAAAAAFQTAHDLGFDAARRNADLGRYRDGYQTALQRQLPPSSPPWQAFSRGIEQKRGGKWEAALATWAQAERLAGQHGDIGLLLQIRANIAAVLADRGKFAACIPLLNQVRDEAGRLGLAKPELLVCGTLGSVMMSGGEVSDPAGALGLFTHVVALSEVHARIVEALPLPPMAKAFETQDSGAALSQLGKLALNHHAYALALQYAQQSVDIARRNLQALGGDRRPGEKTSIPFELPNRLSGLIAAGRSAGKADVVDEAARELERLLAQGRMTMLGQLVAHRALGSRLTDSEPKAAIAHFQAACAIAETFREQMPLGSGRANVSLQHRDVFGRLARTQARQGAAREAFEALQGMRDRHLLEAAAARAKAVSDRPPSADEAMALLAGLVNKAPVYLVELLAEDSRLTAFIVDAKRVRSVHVDVDVGKIEAADRGDLIERPGSLIRSCLDNPDIASLVAKIVEQIPPKSHILLSADGFISNLPLHMAPVQGRSWCDVHGISYLSGIGPLKYMGNVFDSGGLVTVAGDSLSDLAGAAVECTTVARLLGDGKPLLGEACTVAAVVDRLESAPHLLAHFALHGRGDARHGQRASLKFSDGAGGSEWIDSRKLFSPKADVRLVVLSGCSTAVSGPSHGFELVSLTRNAIQTGASSVVACLWPVEDAAAEIFMTHFYRSLAAQMPSGVIDLVDAMDAARTALRGQLERDAAAPLGRRRDGRNFSLGVAETREERQDVLNAQAWAPFVLFGQPVLRASGK